MSSNISTPMQPTYLTGHSRPVNQVKHNFDGDLLFTCSDDGTVCMFETFQLVRLGVFKINQACLAIDITKDSKYLLAAAATIGPEFYNIKTGEKISSVKVPGVSTTYVAFAFGDEQFLVLYTHENASYIRVYSVQDCLKSNTPKEIHEIKAPGEFQFTKAVWGPKNESLFVATTNGKLFQYNFETKSFVKEEQAHRGPILSLDMTYDYTMLMTGSHDGYAKLIHPETFQTVREFNYEKPCRSASISPLFDSDKHQKFHVILSGGQDARSVTTTAYAAQGFEM